MMKGKITILFLILVSVSFSQNWETLATDAEFTIEQDQIICKSSQGYDYQYTVLKLTNLTNKDILIGFNAEQWYNNECYNCNDADTDGGYYTFKIAANSSVIGDCDSRGALRIFHHSITVHPNAYQSTLTSLKVENAKILK